MSTFLIAFGAGAIGSVLASGKPKSSFSWRYRIGAAFVGVVLVAIGYIIQ